MAAIESPFAHDGLQPAIAARDQQIALLEYKLRCADADIRELQSQATGGAAAAARSAPPPHAAQIARWLGSDEDGVPATPHERRTLNALVRRYLLARGYKATAVSLAEEVTDQDLSLHADDAALLAMPGARRGGGAAPVLSLLAMHRKRIAPIQALAENEVRSAGVVDSLRAELRLMHEQLDSANAELAATRERLSAAEVAALRAASMRAGGAASAGLPVGAGGGSGGSRPPSRIGEGAAVAASPALRPALIAAAPPSLAGGILAPLASPAMLTLASPAVAASVASVSLVNTPALLRALDATFNVLGRTVVSRQRAAFLPLISAAAAAEAAPTARRALIVRMLTLLRRPSHTERHVIRTQVGVLATRLGADGVEAELLPEVVILAKSGRTKERKALAAVLAGELAPHVSDKRCDALLATLADLAPSRHAVVRVGVVMGLAALARTVAARWDAALASGAILGSDTAVEAFVLRQFGAVEELAWTALLAGGAEVEGEDEELAAAAAAEFPLGLPASLLLLGAPPSTTSTAKSAAAGAAAAAASSSSGGGSAATAAPIKLSKEAAAAAAEALPWAPPPPSVAAAVATELMPVLVGWAHRLGVLWTHMLPGLLGLLGDTLHVAAPPAAGGPGSSSLSGAVDRAGAAEAGGGALASFTSGSLATASAASAAATIAAAAGYGLGRGAASVRGLTDWHLRRARLLLGALTAAAPRIREALLADGPSVELTGKAPAPAGGAAAAASGDSAAGGAAAVASAPAAWTLELFDFTSRAAVDAATTASPAAVFNALLRGTVATRRRRADAPPPPQAAAAAAAAASGPSDAPAPSPAAAAAAGTWSAVHDDYVLASWPALRLLVRGVVATLVRQAALVSRSSAAGRAIVDAYSLALCAIGCEMGPAFTSLAIRPMFLRAFGVPVELPPPAAAAAAASPASPGPAAALAAATGASGGGRQSSLVLWSQILFGAPAPASAAGASSRKLSDAAAPQTQASSGPTAAAAAQQLAPFAAVSFKAAGARGSEWPAVMPELAWLARDSPDNPVNFNVNAAGARRGAAPAPAAAATAATSAALPGGVWNAEALLPVFGSGVLCCGALPRDALDHALRALIVAVATNRAGWGAAASALEDAVMRAGGGNSATGTSASSTKPTAASTSNALAYMLSDVLPRATTAESPPIRATVAGLYASLIPLLSPAQVSSTSFRFGLPVTALCAASITALCAASMPSHAIRTNRCGARFCRPCAG